MAKAEWFVEEKLTHEIIGAFYKTYNTLGFGFMESVYSVALCRVLQKQGHEVAREVYVPVYFEGEMVARQRLDHLVDGKVIVELKASEHLHRDAPRQLLSYLKATQLEVGLLLHFGRRPSFYRVANRRDQTNR